MRRRAATARGSRAARCAAATPTRRSSTRRRPTRASAARRATRSSRDDLALFRALYLPVSGDRIQSGSPIMEVLFPTFGDEPEVFLGVAGRDGVRLNQQQILTALESGPYRRTWELAQQLRDDAETQEDVVQSVLTYLRRGLRLHRDAAAVRPSTSTASSSTPRPATASSSRARWRCCCGWPASPRAWSRASPPARWTPRRRSTSCATSTPTRGSRSGTAASAG